jgi:hypothetical protein
MQVDVEKGTETCDACGQMSDLRSVLFTLTGSRGNSVRDSGANRKDLVLEYQGA